MTDESEDPAGSRATRTPVGGMGIMVVAAVLVTVLLWSSAFVVIRDVGQALSPAPMALLRLAVAAIALTVAVLARRRRSPIALPSPKPLVLTVFYGVLWLAGYTVALNAAERHVDAGTAALLVNIAPLLVAFGAGRFLGEGYPRPLIIGSLVALCGVAIIGTGVTVHRDGPGVVLSVLAAVLYSAGVLIQKAALRSVDGLTALWLGCLAGTVVLLPWASRLFAELSVALSAGSPGAVLGGVYLGLFPTAIGFTTWSYALRRGNAGRLTATTYAVPAVSVLLSWLSLGEVPMVSGLIGGAICLIGVAISRWTPSGGPRRIVAKRRGAGAARQEEN